MMGILTDQVAMLFSTPITLSLVIIEIIISMRFDKQYYTVKDTKSNLVLGQGYVILDTASRAGGIFSLAVIYYYGFQLSILHHQGVGYWIALVLLEDLVYWFMHKMDHQVRFLWAGHIH